MTSHVTLLLGGARSGKSALAERLAGGGKRVLFIATAEALDEEMTARIEAHRQGRTPTWDTLEEPRQLQRALRPHLHGYDVFLLDCVTMWVSNLLLDQQDPSQGERPVVTAAAGLLDMMRESQARWILVSNEVGMGLVPASRLGRAFRDTLGRVNQTIASRADQVTLMVAGLPVDIPIPT